MRADFTARLGLAALLLVPAGLPAQQNFEGSITYQMTAEGMTMTMTYLVKGTKIRANMEAPGMPGPMYLLMDLEGEVMQSVLPSMGMYMEMKMQQMMDQIPVTPEMQEAMKNVKIESLGTTEQIAGITCTNYRFIQGNEEMEGCIATGMGFFMGGARPAAGAGGAGMFPGMDMDLSSFAQEFNEGMLPLRMRFMKNGAWVPFMEATAVERKSLDAQLFVLPSGLRKMSMPGG